MLKTFQLKILKTKELFKIVLQKGHFTSIKGHLCLTNGHLDKPEG